jgi:predicted CoA-binding protein
MVSRKSTSPTQLLTNEEKPMNDHEMRDMLSRIKTIAVVGISPKEDRPSYIVASYLKSKGYRILPVRPDGNMILGEKVYSNLMEIPKEIEVDVVDIFRKSDEVLPIVEEAIQRGAKVIWMQEGVISPEAGLRAERAGLKVVMDRCIKKEHQRLL